MYSIAPCRILCISFWCSDSPYRSVSPLRRRRLRSMVEQRRMARINLIGWDNGRGLSHDLRLLRETLESLGHEVHFTPTGPKRHRLTPAAVLLCIRLLWRWLLRGCRGPWKFDANIMLEHVRPAYLGLARRNLFIPNPEWMSQRDERHLHQID